MANTTLGTTVDDLRTKADDYQEATNFEAKLQEYRSEASSLQSSLFGLKNRLEEAERLNAIHTRVFENDSPQVMEDARQHTRQVLDRSNDDYWQCIDEDQTDQYLAKVQTAKSKADDARQALRTKLNDEQSKWENRVQSARLIQKLMASSRDAEELTSDIGTFVRSRMWDDDADITKLKSEWQALERKWEGSVVVDWDELQEEYGIGDDTIDILNRLAEGQNVSFDSLDESIADDILGADDLKSALKVTL